MTRFASPAAVFHLGYPVITSLMRNVLTSSHLTAAPRPGNVAPLRRNQVSKAKAKSKGPEDWRDATLARMRALILEADPGMTEERKWRKPSNGMAGVPVWSHDGIVCTGEIYTKAVKLTFAHGARLADPSRLFNSSLEGNTRRAIDIHEGEAVNAAAFKALIKAAVAANRAAAKSVD